MGFVSWHVFRPETTDYLQETILPLAEVTSLRQTVDALQDMNLRELASQSIRSGTMASKYRGQGLDLVDLRSYQLGDDVRHIDWHTTARMGHPYVKVFKHEMDQEMQIVLQQDAGMYFGTRRELKIASATRVALMLLFNAWRREQSSSCIVIRERTESHPRFQGEQAVMHMAMYLNTSSWDKEPCYGRDSVFSAWSRYGGDTQDPKQLFLIRSGPSTLTDMDKSALKMMCHYHSVAIVEILDPIDMELPKAGWCSVLLSKGQSRRINTNDSEQRRVYQEARQTILQDNLQYFSSLGVSWIPVMNDQDTLKQIRSILT